LLNIKDKETNGFISKEKKTCIYQTRMKLDKTSSLSARNLDAYKLNDPRCERNQSSRRRV